MTPTAPPSQPVPFVCTASTVFLSQNLARDTQLYSAAGATPPPPPFVAVGSPSPERYNGLGYNSSDKFLYASSKASEPPYSPGHLLMIDSTGTVFDLGALPAASAAALSNGFTAGAFGAGASAGTYYGTDPSPSPGNAGASNQMYVDPITPNGAASTVTMTKAPIIADWTYDYGFLWGVDQRNGDKRIARISPATGVVTEWPQAVVPSSSYSYGAAWSFGSRGNLWFFNNHSGKIYRVKIHHPHGAPTFSLVSVSHTTPDTGNDAATCGSGPRK